MVTDPAGLCLSVTEDGIEIARRPQAADAVEVVTVYDFTYERFRQGVARRFAAL